MMIEFTTYNVRSKILTEIGLRCEWLLTRDLGLDFEAATLYWARQSLAPQELPAAVITPGLEEADRDYGIDKLTLPVSISLVCLLGTHSPIDFSEHLLSQLRQKIPMDDPTLGGLAQDTRYIQGGVEDYPDTDDQALVVTATFEIDYETEINNPDKGV